MHVRELFGITLATYTRPAYRRLAVSLGLTFMCAMVFLPATACLAAEESREDQEAAKPKAEAQWKLLEIERNIIQFTNEERARYGLPSLEPDKELVESARQHAIWMTRYRTLQHTSRPVAENIAMGYQNSRDVVRGWMNSSGHRANILNRSHRKIGVAAYVTEHGTIYWCQQFRR